MQLSTIDNTHAQTIHIQHTTNSITDNSNSTSNFTDNGNSTSNFTDNGNSTSSVTINANSTNDSTHGPHTDQSQFTHDDPVG